MKVYEKIKFMRQQKGYSQEEMAEKLQMSISGYANIERGTTDVQISRLEQISQVLDMNLLELLNFGEKNVLFLNSGNNNQFISINSSEQQMASQLEKALSKIEHLQTENDYLKEIIELLKK